MQQSDNVQYWNNTGRTGTRVGWALGDLENLRDFLLDQLGTNKITVPDPHSPLGMLIEFLKNPAAAGAGAGAAPTDAQVNAAMLAALQNPQVQQGIADKLAVHLAAAAEAAGKALTQ